MESLSPREVARKLAALYEPIEPTRIRKRQRVRLRKAAQAHRSYAAMSVRKMGRAG